MKPTELFFKSNRPLTPLSIFALLIGTLEMGFIYAITRTTGTVQLALTVFVMALTLLVVALFFAVFWFRPHHFYSPSEYKKQFGVREHAEAIYQTKVMEYAKVPTSKGSVLALKEEEEETTLSSMEARDDD